MGVPDSFEGVGGLAGQVLDSTSIVMQRVLPLGRRLTKMSSKLSLNNVRIEMAKDLGALGIEPNLISPKGKSRYS